MLQVNFCSWQNLNNQGLCNVKDIKPENLRKISIPSTGIVYRNQLTFQLIFVPTHKTKKSGVFPDHQALFYVTEEEGRFKITDLKSNQSKKTTESLVMIAPSLDFQQEKMNQGLLIKEGDIIRIGKVKIEVLKLSVPEVPTPYTVYRKIEKPMIEKLNKISISDYETSPKNSFDTNLFDSMQGNENYSMVSENPCCKICYSKTISQDNNLFSCCMCTGTSKFLHKKCLKTWIQMRTNITSTTLSGNKFYQADMSVFSCEICKSNYDIDILLGILFPEVGTSYVVLVVEEKENCRFFLFDLDQSKHIDIGRDETSHIFLADLTCSRKHCLIGVNEMKELRLVDLGSKFGSTIKKASCTIQEGSKYRFHKGRTYIEVERKKNKKSSLLDKFRFCQLELY